MVGGYIFFERSRKMAISKDNVKSNFMELSGLDSTSAEVYAGLITVCADEMEKAVDQERMIAEGGTAICEFAAAAEVFYRFICLKAAEYKVMFTAQGKAVEAFDEENRIKAARELRDSAVSRAERFFSKDGFVLLKIQRNCDGSTRWNKYTV